MRLARSRRAASATPRTCVTMPISPSSAYSAPKSGSQRAPPSPRRSRRCRPRSAAASARSASTSTCRRTSPCSARGRSRSASGGADERGRRGEQLLHRGPRGRSRRARVRPPIARPPSASARGRCPGRERSGRSAPSSGSSTPSKSIDSTRTWSWKHSRCRSRSHAAERRAPRAAARSGRRRRRRARPRAPRREQPGVAAAAGDVGLQAVDARRRRLRKSRSVSPYSPAAISRPGGPCVAQQPQPVEVVGRDRLLEPASRPTRARSRSAQRERLLARERAVRVDEELRVVADRLARRVEPRAGRRPARGRPSSSRAGSPPRPSRRAARAAARASTSMKPPLP